jgi:hypothetical protein
MPNEQIKELIKKLDKGQTLTRHEYFYIMRKFLNYKINNEVFLKLMDKAKFNANKNRGDKLYDAAKSIFDPNKLPYKD